MAENKKAKRANPRPKKAKTAATVAKKPAKAAANKPRKRATKKAAPVKTKRAALKQKAAPRRPAPSKSATINIFELIDHPLVADLLSVGAMAAVAAIADHNVKTRTGEAESGSSRAVKAAGKAAASAMGKRLLTEVDAIKKASKPQPTKRGSK
jgi:hypothetical protein